MAMSDVDLARGPITKETETARVRLDALTGFGIFQPLEKRIKLVMNNIASNREIYNIDPSVAKASEGVSSADGIGDL